MYCLHLHIRVYIMDQDPVPRNVCSKAALTILNLSQSHLYLYILRRITIVGALLLLASTIVHLATREGMVVFYCGTNRLSYFYQFWRT